MKKEVVRNHSVYCFESHIRNILNDSKIYKYKNIAQMLKKHTRDEILSSVCSESKAYSELMSLFVSANESLEDNDMFVFAYRVTDNCLIRIDESNRIIVYYYQDRFRIGGEAIFPWDYPHVISCLGVSKDSDSDAAEDFLSLNTVDYFLKYTPDLSDIRNEVFNEKASGVYEINESLSVVVDEHIVFRITDKNGCAEERYIADPWWYDDKEILNDLLDMPISSFGNKYQAYWCL